jgi:hypothetical protein
MDYVFSGVGMAALGASQFGILDRAASPVIGTKDVLSYSLTGRAPCIPEKNSIQEVWTTHLQSYSDWSHVSLSTASQIFLTVVRSPPATLSKAMPSRASLKHVHPAAAQWDELRLAQVKAV